MCTSREPSLLCVAFSLQSPSAAGVSGRKHTVLQSQFRVVVFQASRTVRDYESRCSLVHCKDGKYFLVASTSEVLKQPHSKRAQTRAKWNERCCFEQCSFLTKTYMLCCLLNKTRKWQKLLFLIYKCTYLESIQICRQMFKTELSGFMTGRSFLHKTKCYLFACRLDIEYSQ